MNGFSKKIIAIFAMVGLLCITIPVSVSAVVLAIVYGGIATANHQYNCGTIITNYHLQFYNNNPNISY